MKVLILTIALCASLSSFSQTTPVKEGYWVVETSKGKSGEAIVYYYSADHQLIHKEIVSGRKIKATKRSHQLILNDSLSLVIERKKAEEKSKTVKL